METKFKHHPGEVKLMDPVPLLNTIAMTGIMKRSALNFIETNNQRRIAGRVLPDQSKITQTNNAALKSNDANEASKMRIINFGGEYFLTNDCFDYSLSKLYYLNVKNGTNTSSLKNDDHKQLAHFCFFSTPVCDYQNRLLKKSRGFAERPDEIQ